MLENLQKHSFVPRAGFENYFRILVFTEIYYTVVLSYLLIIKDIAIVSIVIRAPIRY